MANIMLSDLYGKQIISSSGQIMGAVGDIIIDFEKGAVYSLLLTKIDDVIRSDNTAQVLAKNSVKYERVKSVSQSIIVSSAPK
jgi:sporulation protein YlmC with PRC-barrel domain